MIDINISFCRQMLAMAQANVRRAFPGVKLNRNTIGVCGPHGRNQYWVEVRMPSYPAFDNYYSADNAYDAKAQAWRAFFDKYAPEQVKREVEASYD